MVGCGDRHRGTSRFQLVPASSPPCPVLLPDRWALRPTPVPAPLQTPTAARRSGGSAEAQLSTDLPLGLCPPHSQVIACILTPRITGGWLHTRSFHPPHCSSFLSFSCSCVRSNVYSWSLARVSQRFCFSNWTLTDTSFLKANILLKYCVYSNQSYLFTSWWK